MARIQKICQWHCHAHTMTPLSIRKSVPPPVVSPRAMTLEGLTGRWEIIRCIPRHVKQMAWKLHDAGFGYYLPMKRSGGKESQRDLPEFPGLLFACAEDIADLRWRFSRSRESSVITFIPEPNQRRLIGELSVIEHTLRDKFVMKKVVEGFDHGTPCEVITGAFMGHEGLVDSTGKGYVKLEIRVLGELRLVEIDPKHLRKLDRPPLCGKSLQLVN